MPTLTNRTSSPFDLHTLAGPAIIPAHGTITAEFEPAYLLALTTAGMIEVQDGNEQPFKRGPGRPRKEYTQQ